LADFSERSHSHCQQIIQPSDLQTYCTKINFHLTQPHPIRSGFSPSIAEAAIYILNKLKKICYTILRKELPVSFAKALIHV
jgi:hypothetical protein